MTIDRVPAFDWTGLQVANQRQVSGRCTPSGASGASSPGGEHRVWTTAGVRESGANGQRPTANGQQGSSAQLAQLLGIVGAEQRHLITVVLGQLLQAPSVVPSRGGIDVHRGLKHA